jgi:hypothetical protein
MTSVILRSKTQTSQPMPQSPPPSPLPDFLEEMLSLRYGWRRAGVGVALPQTVRVSGKK